MPKPSRRGKDRFSNQFVEKLEARQLLSGVAAATAAGFIWPNSQIPSFRINSIKSTGSTRTANPTATTSPTPTATAAVSVPDNFPGAVQYPAGSGDYATGHAGHKVGWIVIHTTESTASSTINEFTTPNLQVSANYMVQRNGVVDQFVSNNNTAYHCGNLAYNESSIGIEHERYTTGGMKFDPTEQEYEASATLVRWLDTFYSIPLAHLAASVAPADPSTGSDVIGHYQVPDPNNPSLGGGSSHHTDPVDWDWTHYMDLCTTTTTPLMPVVSNGGSVGSTPTLNGTSQTLSWMQAPNATSYKLTVKDTTANTTNTYTVNGGATTSLALTFTNGHTYSWTMISLNGTTQSIVSPTYTFAIGASTTLTDAQKQSLMLTMVNNHRGSVQSDVVLAEITQEGGQGAFYVNGSTHNSFYSASIQPWCQPTNNSDGIMQVTSASGFDTHKPYANTQQGYDDAINDGTAYLSSTYSTYGTLWQASLHYNTGPNSLYIYKNNMGDKNYLAHIGTDLSFVQSTFGIADPALVDKYNAAQTIVNSFLNNANILSGQAVSYYSSYQTQLDAQLHALGAADDAPNTPTNTSPANAATNVSLTPTLSASAYSDPNAGDAQTASEWVIKRVSDGTIVYDSGTDTTDTNSTLVPNNKLAAGTQYSWQVRYADTEGTWSSYSTAATFSTSGGTNNPPNTPTNTGPANNASVTVTPTLLGSTFADVNISSSQAASEWQIYNGATLVYDSGVDATDLTSLTVPSGKLSVNTTYTWKVRYEDNYGNWSSYSTATSFTTVNQPPTIGSLTATPNPHSLPQGYHITLTPGQLSDPDGTVAAVQYYVESNGVSGLQTGAGGDTLLATANSATNFVGTLDTSNWAVGSVRLFAIAVDDQGATSAYQTVTFTINAPLASVTATATGGRTAHLTWSGAPATLDGFIIERSTDGQNFTQVGTAPAAATGFDDSGLTPGAGYTYRVKITSGQDVSTPTVAAPISTWRMGDTNGDGKVDLTDYNTLAANFNQAGGWAQGDFDGDGTVTLSDYNLLVANFTS